MFVIHISVFLGDMLEKGGVVSWIMSQKNDQSIEFIDRVQLLKYIETKEFLAVMFCELYFLYYLDVYH